jgi:hypothetical protein
MNACIFILTVNALCAVYGNDRTTQINQLNPGDRVCVLEIDNDAFAVHWSNGAQGHGGWLRHVHVAKPAVEAVPTYQEN